jgi:hypothetical protein
MTAPPDPRARLEVGGDFTVTGSFSIVLIYAVVMIPAGVVAAQTVRCWRWLIAAAGSVVLFFPAVGVASDEVGSTAGPSGARWVLLAIASLAVFATIAVVPLVTIGLVDRWTRAAPARDPGYADA